MAGTSNGDGAAGVNAAGAPSALFVARVVCWHKRERSREAGATVFSKPSPKGRSGERTLSQATSRMKFGGGYDQPQALAPSFRLRTRPLTVTLCPPVLALWRGSLDGKKPPQDTFSFLPLPPLPFPTPRLCLSVNRFFLPLSFRPKSNAFQSS